MLPKKKPVTVSLGMHYATVAALLISNITVLALAMLFANNVLGGSLAYFAALEVSKGSAAVKSVTQKKAPPLPQQGRYESALTVGALEGDELPVYMSVTNKGSSTITSFEVASTFVPQDVVYLASRITPTVVPSFPGAFGMLWQVPAANLAPGATWQAIAYFNVLDAPQHLSTKFTMETRYVQISAGHSLPNQYNEAWYFFDDAVSTANPPVHNLTLSNEHLRTWREGSNVYHSFRVSVTNQGNIGFRELWFLYNYDHDALAYVQSPLSRANEQSTLRNLFVQSAHAVSIDFPTTLLRLSPEPPTNRCALAEISDVHPAGCDMAHGDTLQPGATWATELVFRQTNDSQSYESGLLKRILPWLFGIQKTNAQVSIDFPDLFAAQTTASIWSAVDVNGWGLNQDISDTAEFRFGN